MITKMIGINIADRVSIDEVLNSLQLIKENPDLQIVLNCSSSKINEISLKS